jgi:hypothetical protein
MRYLTATNTNPAAKRGKYWQSERKDAAYHQDITNYFKPSEENKKTDLNPQTASGEVVEPENYETSSFNCDVSRTEIPVPLQEEAPEKVSILYVLKHSG